MGRDDEIIVNRTAVPDHLRCPICTEVVKDAVQCDNQHVFCLECMSHAHVRRTGRCPTCRCAVVQPQPSRLAQNLVDDLLGACPNACCDSTMKLSEINRHMQSDCKFRPTQCPNVGCTTVVPFYFLFRHDRQCPDKLYRCSHTGCKKTCRRAALRVHFTLCEWRKVKCVNHNIGCNVQVSFRSMETHIDIECKFTRFPCRCGSFVSKMYQSVHNATCPKFDVLCPNAGCKHTCQREALRQHQEEECPFQVLPCPNSTCTQRVRRNLIAGHRLQECAGERVRCHHDECRLEYLRSEHARHVDVCKYTSISCPSNGCAAHFLRKNTQKHLKKCKQAEIQCPGCKRTMSRAQHQFSDHADTCDEVNILCPLKCGVRILRKNVESHSAKCPRGPWICPNCCMLETNAHTHKHVCPELKTVVQELLAERRKCTGLEAMLQNCSTSSERVAMFERACEQGNLNAVTALAVQSNLGGRLMKKDVRERCLQFAFKKPFDIVRFMSAQRMVTNKDIIDMATKLNVNKALLGLGFKNDKEKKSIPNTLEPHASTQRNEELFFAALPVPVDETLFARPQDERLYTDADGVHAVLYVDAWYYLIVCTECGCAVPNCNAIEDEAAFGVVCRFDCAGLQLSEKQPTSVCIACRTGWETLSDD